MQRRACEHSGHRTTHVRAAIIAALAGCVVGVNGASAAIINWTNVAGGNAATPSNWNPQQLPGPSDVANFGVSGAPPISWGVGAPTTIQDLHVNNSCNLSLTFSVPLAVSGTINVQSTSTGFGAIQHLSGTITTNALVVGGVGSSSSTNATLNLTGVNSHMLVDSSFVMGLGDAAFVQLSGGSSMTVNAAARFGAGAPCTFTVTGVHAASQTRSTLRTTGPGDKLRVGDGGMGDIRVRSGASVECADDLLVGPFAGVQGVVSVMDAASGLDARLIVAGDLLIGNNDATGGAGTGTVTIDAGGTVTVSGDTIIGDASPSSGLLSLADGSFTTRSLIPLGTGTFVHESGTITIDGGTFAPRSVGSIFLVAGNNVGTGGGVVNLINGAQWTLPAPGSVASPVFLTTPGLGSTLNILSGSDVSLTGSEFRVGIENETGTVVLDDGSTLTASGILNMGGINSSIAISEASVLTVAGVNVGGNTGDATTLTISGAGSRWQVGGLLRAGHNLTGGGGECQIAITNGGSLASTHIDPTQAALRFRRVNAGGGSLRIEGGSLLSADDIEYSNAVTPLIMLGGSITTTTVTLAGATLTGHGAINANIANTGTITPSGPGFTIAGNLSDNGAGVVGSKLTFADGSSYTGDGVLNCDISADASATFTPSGFLTMGRLASTTGVEFDGVMNITNTGIECFDANGARIGGTVNLNNGELTGLTGLRFEGGLLPRLTGTGLINDDCTMNGRIEPGIANADRTGHLDFVTLTFGVTGSLAIDIEGDQPGDFDTIATIDDLDLNGATLVVNRLDGYYPPRDTRYRIATGSLFGSQFALVAVEGFHLEYGLSTVDLVFDGLCDSIDFNNDEAFFDPVDIDAFLSVFSEGPCIPETATCNDLDFNNDGALFDPCDFDAFLAVFSEGPCTLCGS